MNIPLNVWGIMPNNYWREISRCAEPVRPVISWHPFGILRENIGSCLTGESTTPHPCWNLPTHMMRTHP